jgi:alkanesulfonate monooxygenase SsuD/methylene tetrahydromethanopterin reductase-like flavin-dependent oxidoreductase (luciferase family)
VSASVQINLIYNFRNPPRWHEPWAERYRRLLEQIAWIDCDLPAIDGIRLTEHHFYRDGYTPSPLVIAGGVAATTRRVSIGTNLIQFPLHHPLRIAEDSLQLDIMSDRRFELGIGLGYSEEEFAGFGVDLASRRVRMVEGMSVLRQAFAGDEIRLEGRYVTIPPSTAMPPPIREGGPPIWIGARAPAAIERAARLADGLLALDAEAAAIYLRACDALGRPQQNRRIDRTYWTILAEDPERSLDQVGENMIYRLNEYIARGAFPGVEPYDDPHKAVADGHCLLLDGPAAVREFDAAIAQGATAITITPVMPGESIDGAAERIQFLADWVVPRLSASTS